MGNLSKLLDKLRPSVESETYTSENRSSSNETFVENVSRINVEQTLREIPKRSPVLAELVDMGKVILVGGMYDVETGVVSFYEDKMISSKNIPEEHDVSSLVKEPL